jgi:TMEM175 potassium channel family protein
MEGQAQPSPRSSPRRGQFQRDESELEFGRIVAFSDGVFAIAITLLVLALQIPEGVSDFPETLRDQAPDFFAFALSFAVLAQVWYFHHRFFGSLGRYDGTLVALNFVYLALVTLVPFSSQVIGDYGDESAAAIIYALNIAGLGIGGAVMVRHAFRHSLVRTEVAELLGITSGPRGLLVAGIFLLSIPIAVVDANAAEWSWLAMFLIANLVTRRILHRRAPA